MKKRKKILISTTIGTGILLSLFLGGTYYLMHNESITPNDDSPDVVKRVANTVNDYAIWAEENMTIKNYEYSEQGNETSNQTNQAVLAHNGQWTYYTSGEEIYRVSGDNETSAAREIPIPVNGIVKDLNVTEEHLVYRVSKNVYESVLVVSDLDGSNAKVVTDDNVEYVHVYDDVVYYSNADENFVLYSYDLETEETELVLDMPVFCSIVTDGYIYFTDSFFAPTPEEQGIYRADIDGSDVTKLATTPAWRLQVTDKYIYFLESESSDGSLMRIPLEGGEPEMVIDELITCYLVVEDKVYYSTYLRDDNGYYFFEYDMKSKEVTPIDKTMYYDMAYHGGRIIMVEEYEGDTVVYNPETGNFENYHLPSP